MSSYGIKAKELFSQGYNCSQAVLLAFSDITNLDEVLAAKLGSPFGAGIGGLRDACGAFTGAVMVMGVMQGIAEPGKREKRRELYESVRAYAKKFEEVNGGSIICGELLGLKGSSNEDGAERTRKKPCGSIVESAADALAEFLGFDE